MENGNEWERNAKLVYQAGTLCMNGNRRLQDLNTLLQDFVQNPKWVERTPPLGSWTFDRNGAIKLCVVSRGISGPEWNRRLSHLGTHATELKRQLLSPEFRSTSGVMYEIRVLSAKHTGGGDNKRLTSEWVTTGSSMGLKRMNLEALCLLCDAVGRTYDRRLWNLRNIVVPLGNATQVFYLAFSRDDTAYTVLYQDRDTPWSEESGFAMELPTTP